MEPQTESQGVAFKTRAKTKAYARSWQQFTNRSMELLVQNPTASKFVLKYIPKTHKFILKVIDGYQVVMKKCKAEVTIPSLQELQQIEKFTVYACRAFTNQSNKKVEEVIGEQQKKQANKKKNKKKR